MRCSKIQNVYCTHNNGCNRYDYGVNKIYSCNCCANNSTLFCNSNSTHAKFTKNNSFGIHYLALTSKPILASQMYYKRTIFVLHICYLKIEMSHDRGIFKVLDLSLTISFWVWEPKRSQSLITPNNPNNMHQSVF